MRRLSILFAFGLVSALLVVAAATAAPPNDWCGPDGTKSDHPSCSESTVPPTTEPPSLEACPTEITIETPKPGRFGYECLWTPAEPTSIPVDGVEGTVKIASLDGISSLVVIVRDSAPGDICLLTQEAEDQTGPDGSFVGLFDLSYGSVDDMVEVAGWDPRGYPEGEGPPSFDPYVDQSYWGFGEYDEAGENGTHWCYPQDGIASMRGDLNGPPLHLAVHFRAKRDSGPVSVTLSVEPKSPET